MTTFVAVFTSPDPEAPSVFWGAFANFPDAHSAVDEFLSTHTYWTREEFSIQEFPFGVML